MFTDSGMGDAADITDVRIEMELGVALGRARTHAPEARATGFCLNCDEPLPHRVRWCDHECQVDWQRRRDNERLRITG